MDEKKVRHLISKFQSSAASKNEDFVACIQETDLEKEGKIPFIWRRNYFLTA